MNQSLIRNCSRHHSYQLGRSLNFLLAAVASFAIGIAFYSYQGSHSDASIADNIQKATSLHTNPRELPAFSLVSHLNSKFSNQDLIGSWNMIFFGFTHCPDVCPLTLSILDQVANELADFKNIPRSIFISVDPKRDRPEILKQYVEHFNHDMVGLTGEKQQIDNLAQSMGAIYAIADNTSENYLVDHSAHIFVTAPNGKMVALFSTPHDTKIIANDFKLISKLYENKVN